MIDLIVFSGQGRVPIQLAGGQCISDPWAIAVYLEGTYPARRHLSGSAFALRWTFRDGGDLLDQRLGRRPRAHGSRI